EEGWILVKRGHGSGFVWFVRIWRNHHDVAANAAGLLGPVSNAPSLGLDLQVQRVGSLHGDADRCKGSAAREQASLDKVAGKQCLNYSSFVGHHEGIADFHIRKNNGP